MSGAGRGACSSRTWSRGTRSGKSRARPCSRAARPPRRPARAADMQAPCAPGSRALQPPPPAATARAGRTASYSASAQTPRRRPGSCQRPRKPQSRSRGRRSSVRLWPEYPLRLDLTFQLVARAVVNLVVQHQHSPRQGRSTFQVVLLDPRHARPQRVYTALADRRHAGPAEPLMGSVQKDVDLAHQVVVAGHFGESRLRHQSFGQNGLEPLTRLRNADLLALHKGGPFTDDLSFDRLRSPGEVCEPEHDPLGRASRRLALLVLPPQIPGGTAPEIPQVLRLFVE